MSHVQRERGHRPVPGRATAYGTGRRHKGGGELSGWEVCRMLKRTPDGTRVKVVMLTLEAEAAYRIEADGYLIKGGAVRVDPPSGQSLSLPGPGDPRGLPASS
jgi:CheY-like chemotaxis protein